MCRLHQGRSDSVFPHYNTPEKSAEEYRVNHVIMAKAATPTAFRLSTSILQYR
jgi:hypothetical protein